MVGFFGIDEKPTSSKDPFALRRACLGVLRLITENRINISLKEILNNSNFLKNAPEKVLLLEKKKKQDALKKITNLEQQLLSFG